MNWRDAQAFNLNSLAVRERGEFRAFAELTFVAQTTFGLEPDGKFGPATARALDAWLGALNAGAVAFEPANARSAEALRRMRSMVGLTRLVNASPGNAGRVVDLEYELGQGGRDLDAPDPYTEFVGADGKRRWGCDCTGAGAWAYRWSRAIRDEFGKVIGWRNTDHLHADALRKVIGDVGDQIPWGEARPGDAVVDGKGKKIGHFGVVGDVDASGPLTVVHCNASGGAPFDEDPIARVFNKKTAVMLRVRE